MIDPLRQEVLSSFPKKMHGLITEAVIRKAVELANFSPVKQPLYGLVPLGDGNLLAVHRYSPGTGRVTGDLFDTRGDFLGEVELPPVAVNIFGGYFGTAVKLWFKGDKAYALESDEDELSLVRYAYKLR